jgi:hypothetical protein
MRYFRAADVWKGEHKTTADLARSMNRFVPDDTAFRNAAAGAKVSKAYLARYYLRSLEQKEKGDPEPEHVVNDDVNILNLEHILPQRPSAAWSHIDPDTADAAYRRLGNMVLVRASVNSSLGNDGFNEKKVVYEQSSSLILTKQVLKYDQWGLDEINQRSRDLADLAVLTWPLTI